MDSESAKSESVENNQEVANFDDSQVTDSLTSERENSTDSLDNSDFSKLDNSEATNIDSFTSTGDSETSKLPHPRPSTKRKKDIITNVSIFRQVDEHVMRIPEDAEKTVEALGQYLSKPTCDIVTSSDIYGNQSTRL